MGENPPQPLLRDYDHPNAFQLRSGIRLPTTNANNFELSPQLIRMIQSDQFGGSPHECPFSHLDNFLELCTTIKQNNISEEFIRMHMFQFSLRDKAKHWLRTVEEGSLSTWDEVTRAFLGKYCPPEKTAELRRKITNFNQDIDEALSEAWERFKDYTRKCPHHGFTSWIIVQSFYDGLTPISRANLDSGAGGSLKKLSVDDAYKMIEEVAKHYAYGGDRRQPQTKKGGIHDLSAIDLIASKFDMLAHKLDQATLTPQALPRKSCLVRLVEEMITCPLIATQRIKSKRRQLGKGMNNTPNPTIKVGSPNITRDGSNTTKAPHKITTTKIKPNLKTTTTNLNHKTNKLHTAIPTKGIKTTKDHNITNPLLLLHLLKRLALSPFLKLS
ncbi:uncharacterized protein LOC110722948 [Chenopodium quinoa]|uniref:uncharacterized protein LOC110722948 n=1 Tax=Chenopodium quinoa TaxID=63459 RepID=UPI000B772068|nr:uncharacterized protein LOC110722948 [Chenopodium quinoa]